MIYDPYSRSNQQLLDGAIVGVSLYLAFLIRFEGAIPPYHQYQFWALLLPIITGRLLTNYLFGLHRIQWRYVGFRDAFYVSRAYLTFSAVLLLVRFGLPQQAGIIRVPASVVTIEFLISLLGAMGIRILRRYSYELQAKKATESNSSIPRRLLLIGAGTIGVNKAREMASDPTVKIVGFLDDSLIKLGCMIAGTRVIGTTSQLTEIVRREKVDAVLVCISPKARGSFNRLIAMLDGLPVASKYAPSISEILDSKDGLHLALGYPAETRNGAEVKALSPQVRTPEYRSQIKNKCILITGGAGFIGSSLADRLARDNQVLLLDRFFHGQPYSFTSLGQNPNVETFESDILEGPAVEEVAHRADLVIHAAAIVGVGRVCSYPRETLETNFSGTSRVLKALEKNPRLERFLYFSTSEVFGVNSFRVNEHSPSSVGPSAEARWSYAIAKLAGEHLVKAYHLQVGMPVVTVRPFNVFGPRRLGSHAILRFVLDSLTGNPIEVHGDGSQIRSWCFIDDFCDAIIEMLARPTAIGEDFNIGNPRNTLTILQLAQEILEITGRLVPIKLVPSPCPDIEIRVPSLDKAQQVLGYRPSYDLRRGLEITINWYLNNLEFFEAKTSRSVSAAAGR
jgi:nucleoside-diphosphate-sugar epimerase